jgi:hypothetical protein
MRPGSFDVGRARASLIWTVVGFVAAQVFLTLALECCRQDVNDSEFEMRSARLERAHRAEPERPILLVVGSSRFVTAFHPERMPALTCAEGPAPLVFNFSHFGAGPLMNLVQMKRVLADFQPRWVVLEIVPSFLSFEGTSFLTQILGTRDLRHVHSYLNPALVYGRWLQNRVLPCCKHRVELCDLVVPKLFFDVRSGIRLNDFGGITEDAPDAEPDPTVVVRRSQRTREQYFEGLQQFHIQPDAAAAVSQSILAAQQAGVQPIIMINPESSEYRSWYAPGAEAELHDYLRHLADTYGVPVVDARCWVPDREFGDPHHLFGAPAKRYTEEFARQVLQPLVDGKLHGVIRLTPSP